MNMTPDDAFDADPELGSLELLRKPGHKTSEAKGALIGLILCVLMAIAGALLNEDIFKIAGSGGAVALPIAYHYFRNKRKGAEDQAHAVRKSIENP